MSTKLKLPARPLTRYREMEWMNQEPGDIHHQRTTTKLLGVGADHCSDPGLSWLSSVECINPSSAAELRYEIVETHVTT